MAQMIRRQVYISKRQQAKLKRLAREKGISEAEFIRQAIERLLSSGRLSSAASTRLDPAAWKAARQFMLTLRAQGPQLNQPRQWKREDAYEERLSRYATHSD